MNDPRTDWQRFPDGPESEFAPKYGPNRMVGLTMQGRRMRAGVTLRRMAERCGMTLYALSRVEQGYGELTTAQRDAFDAATAEGARK